MNLIRTSKLTKVLGRTFFQQPSLNPDAEKQLSQSRPLSTPAGVWGKSVENCIHLLNVVMSFIISLEFMEFKKILVCSVALLGNLICTEFLCEVQNCLCKKYLTVGLPDN